MRLVEHALAKVTHIFEAWPAALSGAFAFGWLNLSGWATLHYEYRLVLIVVGAVALDTITGLVAAKHNGDQLSSTKMSRIVEKTVGYGAFTLVVWAVNQIVQTPSTVQSLTIAAALGAVACIELLSILENVSKLNIKRFGRVLAWVRGILNRHLDQLEPKENTE